MIAVNLQHVQTLDQELILAAATRDIQEMVKHVKVRKIFLWGQGQEGHSGKKQKCCIFVNERTFKNLK